MEGMKEKKKVTIMEHAQQRQYKAREIKNKVKEGKHKGKGKEK